MNALYLALFLCAYGTVCVVAGWLAGRHDGQRRVTYPRPKIVICAGTVDEPDDGAVMMTEYRLDGTGFSWN